MTKGGAGAMSGFDKKSTFQDRLDRMQRENGGGSLPDRPIRSKPPARKGGGARLVGFSIIAVLGVGVFGAALYGLRQFNGSVDVPLRQIASNFLANAVSRTPTPASYDGLLSSGPKERKEYDTGWELPSPYVAAPGRTDLLLEQVAVLGPTEQDAADISPEVTTFALNTECTLRSPQAGDVVHNVRLDDTARYTTTHMFSKEELAHAVHDRIEGITRNPKHYKNAAIAKGRMGQVDVFVTDTSAPVYLVLQSFNRDILWNIQLAEGVELAHVAMIGNKSGFAAPAGSFTFEGLRIEDFLERDTLYKNGEMRPCMIAPFNAPDPNWRLMEKVNFQSNSSHYQTFLTNLTEGHAAFSAWYGQQLGVDSDQNLTTALKAAHALVGPVPATPVIFTPLKERDLHVAQNDYVAFGDDQLVAIHDDLLLAATGGDLSVLKQSPMEGIAQ